MQKTALILWFVISLVIPTAYCAAAEKNDHVCFRSLDTDNDGLVTLDEFAVVFENAEETFKAADADKDGRLTHEEYHDLLGHGAAQ